MKTFKLGNRFILFTMIYMLVVPILIGILQALFLVRDFSGAWYKIIEHSIILLGPILFFFKKEKNISILKGKLKIKEIFLLILLSICIKPLVSLTNLISQFFVKNHIAEATESLNNETLIIYLIAIALVPALFEELISRGIIINYYVKQSVKSTILISGFFFGMMHYNINQFVYAFLLGVLLCYIVLITESIFSSIIIHFFINAISNIWPNVLNFTLKNVGKINFKYQNLINETINSSNVSNSQLLVFILLVLLYSLIMTPIAIYVLKLIVKGRNKSLKGSLELKTYELSNIDLEEEEYNEEIENKEKEYIFDGYLVTSSIIFFLIAIRFG